MEDRGDIFDYWHFYHFISTGEITGKKVSLKDLARENGRDNKRH